MHARGGGAQVEGQLLGEGFERRFAGVVGRVAGRVGDALLGARKDDGGGGGGRGQQGEEGREAMDGAVEVRGEDLCACIPKC